MSEEAEAIEPRFLTLDQVAQYLNVHNRRRLHSSLGYLSPADYERRRTLVESTIEEAA